MGCELYQCLSPPAAGVSDKSHSLWVPFAEEAVATIYSLAEHPDRLASVLLMRLCDEVAPSPREGGTDTQRPPEPTLRDFDGDFDPEVMSTQGTTTLWKQIEAAPGHCPH